MRRLNRELEVAETVARVKRRLKGELPARHDDIALTFGPSAVAIRAYSFSVLKPENLGVIDVACC